MPSTFKRKYGIDWGADVKDTFIDLIIAKKYKEFAGMNGGFDHPAEHLLRACRNLFTPAEFTIHKWTEQMARDWTEEDFVMVWGAAATGKSNTAGLFLLLDFCTDPHDTISFVGSTSLGALRRRSWESVQRYATILMKNKEIDFALHPKPSGYAIYADSAEEGDAVVEKAGIIGIALADGGRAQGSHEKYVRFLVDEMAALQGEGPAKALEEAFTNLKAGSLSLKIIGLANPTSRFDLSGLYSEPLAGWSSVNVDSEFWRTKYGIVRHFDGLKSPAITEPDGARKYPFLINQEAVDNIKNVSGEDSVRFSEFVRGFPPEQGNSVTVLTEADIAAGKATDQDLNGVEIGNIVTASPFFKTIRAAAVDAAFSQGGDDAVIQEVRIVYVRDLPTLYFPPPQKIPIVDSSVRPVTYQLVDYIRGWCAERDIPMDMLAADDSGSQSLADVLSVEIGPGVLRVNYSRAASDKPTSVTSPEEARKKLRDCITEGWVILAELVKLGQVRGLSEVCARQLCARQYATNAKTSAILEPRRLEPKAAFKARTKLGSPDEGDAAAMACLLIRHRLGIVPGANVYPQARASSPSRPDFKLSSASAFSDDAPREDPLAGLLGKYGG